MSSASDKKEYGMPALRLIAAAVFLLLMVFGRLCVDASAQVGYVDLPPVDHTIKPSEETEEDIEDIKPVFDLDWIEQDSEPEDIKSLKTKRKMVILEAEEEEEQVEEEQEPEEVFEFEDDEFDYEIEEPEPEPEPEEETEPEEEPEPEPEPEIDYETRREECRLKLSEVPEEPFPASSKEDMKLRRALEVEKIRVSGNLELKAQTTSSSGDEVSFLSQNGLLYFNSKFQQNTKLDISGNLDNGLKINGRFVDTQYQDQIFNLSVTGPNGYAKLGDTTAEFKAGPLLNFRKNIRGLDMMYDFGKYSVSAMMSRQKSKTSSETFRGKNMRGPYVLRVNSLLPGSETIYINGQKVAPSRYTMDYFIGQVTFDFNVDPTDMVEITYESILVSSLKTGSLHGFSVHTDKRNSLYDVGVAYMEEGTSQAERELIYSDSKTFATSEVELHVSYDLGAVRLKRQSVVAYAVPVDDSERTLLDEYTDYVVDYAAGMITFLTLPADSDIVIYFDYYNQNYIQLVENEKLYDDGDHLDYSLLEKRTIYSGTEHVRLFVQDIYQRDLIPGEDYEIDEGNNRIIYLNPDVRPDSQSGIERHIEITYEFVPEVISGSSDSKRKMTDLSGRLTLGDSEFTGEFSETTMDISLKNVQVLEERVATITSDNKDQDEFYLKNEAISNTDEIYLDDPVLPNSRLRSGTDYVLERDPAAGKSVIKLKKSLPLGSTIIANYKYAPVMQDSTGKTGQAARMTGNFRFNEGTLSTEFMKKSNYFAPLNSYNDLENQRVKFDLKMAPKKKLMIGASYLGQMNSADFASRVEYDTQEWKGQMEYNIGKGTRAGYSFSRRTKEDNLEEKETETVETTHRIEAKYTPENRNKVSFTSHLETTNFDDETSKTSDFKVNKGGLLVQYDPEPNLKMSLRTDTNRVKYTTPGTEIGLTDFQINTTSNILDMTYLPHPDWAVMTKFDTQKVKDSRDDIGDTRVDTMNAALRARPANSNIKSFITSYTRQDRPNPYYGDTLTESTTSRLEYEYTCNWLLTPGFTYSKSSSNETSSTLNRTMSMRASFRQDAHKGWKGMLEYSYNRRITSRIEESDGLWSSDKNNQKKIFMSTNFIPSGRMEWKNSATYTQNSVDTGSGDESLNLTTGVDYRYSPSTDLNLSLKKDIASGTLPDHTRYMLESKTLLDEYFTLNMSLEKDQQDGGTRDYDGMIFNMRLNADF